MGGRAWMGAAGRVGVGVRLCVYTRARAAAEVLPLPLRSRCLPGRLGLEALSETARAEK